MGGQLDLVRWPTLMVEVVTCVRAWHAGALDDVPEGRLWQRGLVSDRHGFNPDDVDLSDCSEAELEFAETVCAFVGLTEAGHRRMVFDDDVFTFRQQVGVALLDFGDALVAASLPE